MIKAHVICDGSHKWAKKEFLKPVNYLGWIWRIFEIGLLFYIGGYILYFLSFAVMYDELRRTVITLVICWLVILWTLFSPLRSRNKEKKKMLAEESDGFTREYVIDENGVSVDFSSDEEWGSASIEHRTISKAVETKDFFIFCIDYKTPSCRAYAIGKKEITSGSPEELTALFQDKLGDRFRRKIK